MRLVNPNTNLEEQLRLARLIDDEDHGDRDSDDADAYDAIGAPYTAVKLVKLVLVLDEWIRRGGLLPSAWKPSKETDR